jgi:hypothetical protein
MWVLWFLAWAVLAAGGDVLPPLLLCQPSSNQSFGIALSVSPSDDNTLNGL